MTTPTLTQSPCQCGDRAASECPGEWEPGCDLGANEAHVRVAPKGAEDALAAALAAPVEKAAPSAAQSALDQIELMLGGCDAIEVVRSALSAQQAAQPVAPVKHGLTPDAQPVAGEPAGRLHADGYFTWHRRDGYVLDRRLPCDFYLTPAAPSPVGLVPLVERARELLSACAPLTTAEPSLLYEQIKGFLADSKAAIAAHGIKAGKDGAK